MHTALEHRTSSDEVGASHRMVGSDPALSDVLSRLGERVKPVVLAHERTMAIIDVLRPIFPEGGLVRGRVMSCQGAAATSIASALVRDALVAGAWLALVDVDTFGADAAAEFGIPLERVVRVDTGNTECNKREDQQPASGSELGWIDAMGAAVDGFDIIMTRVPAGLSGGRRSAAMRKLSTRIVQHGAVVVALGDTGELSCDVRLVTERTVWEGLGDGAGHLRRRQIDFVADGRRLPGRRTCQLMVSGGAQRVEISAVTVAAADVVVASAAGTDDRGRLAG